MLLRKLKLNAKNWVSDNKKRFYGNRSTKKLVMCKKCYTFYYKNSWHFYKPPNLQIEQDEEIPVKFTECLACLEEEYATLEMEPNTAFGI